MLRSLYAGVSGLKNHQTKMDVVGNNIANVNTVGFKSSRATFQDIYSQTIQPAAAPSDDGSFGGVNPQQVGLGMALGSIDVMQTRSAIHYTGAPLDPRTDQPGRHRIDSFAELSVGDALPAAGRLEGQRGNRGGQSNPLTNRIPQMSFPHTASFLRV